MEDRCRPGLAAVFCVATSHVADALSNDNISAYILIFYHDWKQS